MKPYELFKKTSCFMWLRLALQAGEVVFSLITLSFAILVCLTQSGVFIKIFAIAVWLLLTVVVTGFIDKYFGYLIKAGHISVITKTVMDEKMLPENQIKYGIASVKSKFTTANVYYIVDSLISKSLVQILRYLKRKLKNVVPGVGLILGNTYTSQYAIIALGSVDDCCLAMTFMQPKKGAFESACNAIVIFSKNWKIMLKKAVRTLFVTLLITFMMALIPIGISLVLFTAFQIQTLWIILPVVGSFFIAVSIKKAVIDSYTMACMVSEFMQVVKETKIDNEDYKAMCSVSKKFKNLFKEAKEENPSLARNTSQKKTAPEADESKDIIWRDYDADKD